MRYEYVVVLKRERENAVNLISILLCSLSILAFLYQQIRTGEVNLFLSFAVLVIAGGLVINSFFFRKKKSISFRIWLLLTGIFWLGMPYLRLLSIPFFLLSFLEYQASYPLEIGFSNDLVIINTLFRKKYAWSAFNNVVLKDGLLTLDFRNNRIFQRETAEDDEPDADEDEFNQYCSRQTGSEPKDRIALTLR